MMKSEDEETKEMETKKETERQKDNADRPP
jgi:hypothetical protein